MYLQKISLLWLLLCTAWAAQGQISLRANEEVKHVAKVGLDNLVFGRFDFAFERQTLPKQSFALEAGFTVPVGIPTRYLKSFTIENISTNNPNDTALSLKLNSGSYKVWHVQPEYRFYFSDAGSPRGFYLGAYGKFKSRAFNTDGYYTRIDTIDQQNMTMGTVSASAAVKGGLRTFGAGVFLGYQFIINDRIAIDISPIGLGIDVHTAYMTFKSSDEDINENFNDWKNAIDGQVKNIPIIGNSFKTSTGTDSNGLPYITSKFSFPFIAYRGNVSVGYSF